MKRKTDWFLIFLMIWRQYDAFIRLPKLRDQELRYIWQPGTQTFQECVQWSFLPSVFTSQPGAAVVSRSLTARSWLPLSSYGFVSPYQCPLLNAPVSLIKCLPCLPLEWSHSAPPPSGPHRFWGSLVPSTSPMLSTPENSSSSWHINQVTPCVMNG